MYYISTCRIPILGEVQTYSDRLPSLKPRDHLITWQTWGQVTCHWLLIYHYFISYMTILLKYLHLAKNLTKSCAERYMSPNYRNVKFKVFCRIRIFCFWHESLYKLHLWFKFTLLKVTCDRSAVNLALAICIFQNTSNQWILNFETKHWSINYLSNL